MDIFAAPSLLIGILFIPVDFEPRQRFTALVVVVFPLMLFIWNQLWLANENIEWKSQLSNRRNRKHSHTLSCVESIIEILFRITKTKCRIVYKEDQGKRCLRLLLGTVIFSRPSERKLFIFGKETKWMGRKTETNVWPVENNDAITTEWNAFEYGCAVCVWLYAVWLKKIDNFHSFCCLYKVDCRYLVQCTTILTCNYSMFDASKAYIQYLYGVSIYWIVRHDSDNNSFIIDSKHQSERKSLSYRVHAFSVERIEIGIMRQTQPPRYEHKNDNKSTTTRIEWM